MDVKGSSWTMAIKNIFFFFKLMNVIRWAFYQRSWLLCFCRLSQKNIYAESLSTTQNVLWIYYLGLW